MANKWVYTFKEGNMTMRTSCTTGIHNHNRGLYTVLRGWT